MSDRTTLKTFFQTGDIPTQSQFADLIDSLAHKTDDGVPGNGTVFTRTWPTLPASSLDLVNIPSISGNVGYAEHGNFRMWHELHSNDAAGASGYDYSFAFGFPGDQGNPAKTNTALWTQEVSYDTGGGWKTNEHYMTYQHANSTTYWAAPRRTCWGVSTFSTNRGNAANGTAIGLVNLDNIQFSSNQPSVAGSKAGWNYCNLTNNYSTGTTLFELISHSTNNGIYQVSVSSTGTAINTTAGLILAAAGGTINLDWSTVGTSSQTLIANAGTATLSCAGATLSVVSPTTYGGGNPALNLEHAGASFGYAHLELNTKATNQVAAISFNNRFTQKWSLFSRGDASDAFQIYNRNTSSVGLSLNNTNNEIATGGRLLLTASTTSRASLNIQSGTAPTTPSNGDIWFDGSDFKCRVGGATKTFTIV
jgi:hypothetical protein